MRFAHPGAEFAPTADARRVLGHPALEVLGADPAWVQLAKGGEERPGLRLELWGRLGGVRSGYGVEERPGGAPQGFDVGGTVGGQTRRCNGWNGGCGWVAGFLGFGARHGEPRGHVGAGAASTSS